MCPANCGTLAVLLKKKSKNEFTALGAPTQDSVPKSR
jgi:hypothetical protein